MGCLQQHEVPLASLGARQAEQCCAAGNSPLGGAEWPEQCWNFLVKKELICPLTALKDVIIRDAKHPHRVQRLPLQSPSVLPIFTSSNNPGSFHSLNDAGPLPTWVPSVWDAGRGCQAGWGTGEGLELPQCTAQPLLRSLGPWQLVEGFKLDKTLLVLLSSSALRAPRG